MYSNYKSIQLVIAALKTYGVHHAVLSPGGSDIPIIHSIETDDFFHCYSVVDERSAVYFGMGISQAVNEPVACVCTSGTAVSNFTAGMTEAFYQNVPIIAITADKSPYTKGQIDTQNIEQYNIFGGVSKKSVELPLCNTADEIWYCERLIKETLVAALYHGKGPVHINLPIIGSYANYNVSELPAIKRVDYVSPQDSEEVWAPYVDLLSKAKKIMVVVGQDINFSAGDIKNIEAFFSQYNCFIATETLSNLRCKGCINTYPITETSNCTLSMVPDVVISMGNNLSAYVLKPFLRSQSLKIRHISIDEGGRYRDVYRSLTDIFECSPSYFFNYIVRHSSKEQRNDMKYFSLWNDASSRIVIPQFPFCELYVAQQLSRIIPAGSILHTAILNSTRIMQFFSLNEAIKCYSNVGALGIDGCLSTFMGQAAVTKDLAFCVIGDLSFFYDMNAAGLRHVGKNVRIVLLNNGGGSEFQFFMSKGDVPTLNNYICAEHKKTAQGWIESLGYEYHKASNKEELDEAFSSFALMSDRPKFIEVFTDMEEDAKHTRDFYSMNRPKPSIASRVKHFAIRVKNKILK